MGEEFFKVGPAMEKNLHVIGILKVFNQWRIGQHGLQYTAHGIISSFPAMTTTYLSKKLFKDVIGALRIDRDLTFGSIDFYRIGEELVGIFIDQLSHLAAERIGGQLVIFLEVTAEQRYSLAVDIALAVLSSFRPFWPPGGAMRVALRRVSNT